jgi:alpha-beta hydrolase superfamily lysophospholipase
VRRIDPGRRRGVGAGSAGGSGRGPDTGCWSGWATSQDDMLRRMTASAHTFTDADGVDVFYRSWAPDDPRAIVLIAHGASEHSARYARIGEFLADRGYAVYALDQRGHGRTADSTGPGRIGPRGTQGMIDDISELRAIATREFPDRSVVALGHSLGSLFVQAYVERHGADVAAYVLSGTMGVMPEVGELAAGIRQAVDAGMADEPLDMLGGFNGGFEPARTPFDWLSRDPDEVDKYVADPLCGDDLPLTYGFVADMLETLAEIMEPAAIDRIPKHLPVYLMTGEADPVSNNAAQVRELEKRLRDAGLDVTAKYYPDARHELLNETNRDEVQADLAAWLDRVAVE